MYICKHCNKQIPFFDDISTHNCFLGKAVFMEENNNILFYCEEDKREYSNREFIIYFSLHMLTCP